MNALGEPVTETNTLTKQFADWLDSTLIAMGVSDSFLEITKLIILLAAAIVVVALLLYVTKRIFNFIIVRAYKVTKIRLLEYMRINKLPYYLAILAPYTFIRTTIPIIFRDFPRLISPCVKLTDIYLVLLVIWSILALVRSFFNILQERPSFRNKPMHSYIQVVGIILYIFGAALTVAIITEQSLGVILGTLGAASAVMMLIFQDSIKGFVGSVQMSTNNIVELGDWITMSKYGADGIVEEVTLNSVKVRNFDQTITTIPTYTLISDSFQNWKGMLQSGGRRFKKCIYIKQGTIRFMTDEELEKFKKIDYLNKVIKEKEIEYASLDRNLIDNLVPVTNNDLFMAYATHYLKNHKRIAQNMSSAVRQLPPTTTGIPVEIGAFTATTVGIEYENIATDIINHLVAMVPTFSLKVFEYQSDTPGN